MVQQVLYYGLVLDQTLMSHRDGLEPKKSIAGVARLNGFTRRSLASSGNADAAGRLLNQDDTSMYRERRLPIPKNHVLFYLRCSTDCGANSTGSKRRKRGHPRGAGT
jgi:hypothetical protein